MVQRERERKKYVCNVINTPSVSICWTMSGIQPSRYNEFYRHTLARLHKWKSKFHYIINKLWSKTRKKIEEQISAKRKKEINKKRRKKYRSTCFFSKVDILLSIINYVTITRLCFLIDFATMGRAGVRGAPYPRALLD